jgi:glutamine synthetase
MSKETSRIPELFGSCVFNEDTMAQYVPKGTMDAWRACLRDGQPLTREVANNIADGMKTWALSKGATHFTHWFQPMTGFTAEKHDSFISPVGGGRVIMDFSGKELVRGEPDASSFPSGGLRATFEARGYTAWDPTAFAFIKDQSLYIPTVFCSYSGEALDKKTPLLRSMEAVSRQALRVLRLFGDTTAAKVTPQVGPEQEYFLVDKEQYLKREDLRLCGRTLFGAKPPKGQELDDHYFGSIRPRVTAYMQDLDEELWKLGIYSKTKHNEVAPSQHEMAPIYCDANTACDQNQLTMEVMKKVADRHGLVCLLHEKPFAGVNGSGKHNNWSLATDTGKNLFAPGKTPSQNAQFLLFLTAFIQGVDEYQELLRSSVAFAGNDHRLGAQEAPPAIISVFLGEELQDIIDSILGDTSYTERGKRALRIGVDVLPTIPQDTTDRNRTSPVAFTGNKFEFRMLGSSQSIAGPNIVLNTVMAEELSRFADKLEGSANFEADLHTLVKESLAAHRRIIFNGNGYEESWVEEAEKRGLANLRSTPEALPKFVMEKNLALMLKHGVFTKGEMMARHEIHMENYCKIIRIEAATLIDMVQHMILGAGIAYSGALCKTIESKKAALPGDACRVETALAGSISHLDEELLDRCAELKTALETMPAFASGEEEMKYCHDVLFAGMNRLRETIDHLETLVASDYWPVPTYCDLLFSV